MPLHIDLLYSFGGTAMAGLCQYCEHPDGYMVADSFMMTAVHMNSKTVEALVFQNYLGTTINDCFGQWLSIILTDDEYIPFSITPAGLKICQPHANARKMPASRV